MLDRMLRVDHAGEFGADRIYAGQMAVLGDTEVGPMIQHMWDQEKHHLATFNKLLPEKRARAQLPSCPSGTWQDLPLELALPSWGKRGPWHARLQWRRPSLSTTTTRS